eukprot:3931662-Rhodomonas_salina.1
MHTFDASHKPTQQPTQKPKKEKHNKSRKRADRVADADERLAHDDLDGEVGHGVLEVVEELFALDGTELGVGGAEVPRDRRHLVALDEGACRALRVRLHHQRADLLRGRRSQRMSAREGAEMMETRRGRERAGAEEQSTAG